ncbi:Alpha/Beta hydrolase protein [Cadophora sp. MPI-SDFR-AT-0126]|nr:Alpha/Beta hydrolase protein [Leotiomycetes sp. MPI-SDFR-AT-0126]
MTSSAPGPPHASLINGLNHIPLPPVQDFVSKFDNLLPEGSSIPSSLGTTRFYDCSPRSTSSARRVMMLHGGGTPAVAFSSLARQLNKSRNHVVTYDLWGHGPFSSPLETHAPALMHPRPLKLLSYLRWTSAHIMGFSIGRSIAARFTAVHPHMVESRTLLSLAGLLREKDRGWWERLSMDGHVFRPRKERSAAKNGMKERVRAGAVDSVTVETWQRENHGGHVASWLHATYKVLTESDVRVLVLVGSEDGVFPEEMLRRELGGGAGHGIVGSHFENVERLVEEFWN